MSIMRDLEQNMRDAIGVESAVPPEQKGPSMFGKVFNSFLRQQQMMQNFKQNRLTEMEREDQLAKQRRIEEQSQRAKASSVAHTTERRKVSTLDFSDVSDDGLSL